MCYHIIMHDRGAIELFNCHHLIMQFSPSKYSLGAPLTSIISYCNISNYFTFFFKEFIKLETMQSLHWAMKKQCWQHFVRLVTMNIQCTWPFPPTIIILVPNKLLDCHVHARMYNLGNYCILILLGLFFEYLCSLGGNNRVSTFSTCW